MVVLKNVKEEKKKEEERRTRRWNRKRSTDDEEDEIYICKITLSLPKFNFLLLVLVPSGFVTK